MVLKMFHKKEMPVRYEVEIFNKNVDIKFSAHDAFLELPSSGMFKVERLESQIMFGASKSNGLNRIKFLTKIFKKKYHIICLRFLFLLQLSCYEYK